MVLDFKVLEVQDYLCERTKFMLSYFQSFGTTNLLVHKYKDHSFILQSFLELKFNNVIVKI